MLITSVTAVWFLKNSLVLNISKTNYILLRQSRNKSDYKNAINLNNTEINYASSSKFLDVRVGENLTWSCYVTLSVVDLVRLALL